MAKTPTPAKAPAAAPPAEEPELPEQEQSEADQTDAEAVEQATIPARVLVDHGRHQCNTLALLTEAEAANCDGWADTSNEAVAFVKSLED